MSVQSKVGLFAFGMIAGAALGLLFAPEAGEDMRENLSTAVRKGVERATEQAQNGCSGRKMWPARHKAERATIWNRRGTFWIGRRAHCPRPFRCNCTTNWRGKMRHNAT